MQMETGEPPPGLEAYSGKEKAYDAALLIEAGFVKGSIVPDRRGGVRGASMSRLTWEGHDFLDAARNDTIWNKAKEKVLKPGLSWTFSMLLEYLKAEAHAQMVKHGLIPS